MYYQNYEDYMRAVLGYPIEQNTYENYPAVTGYELPNYPASTHYSDEIVNLYPEIYKLVQPMVCKICEANTKPITQELLDQMAEEIYLNLESTPEVDSVVNIRVNVPKETDVENQKSVKPSSNHTRITPQKTETKPASHVEEKKETRSPRRNSTLQDLIKILILNQLLGGGRPGQRPPSGGRPPYPPRPPIPPRPRENRRISILSILKMKNFPRYTN